VINENIKFTLEQDYNTLKYLDSTLTLVRNKVENLIHQKLTHTNTTHHPKGLAPPPEIEVIKQVAVANNHQEGILQKAEERKQVLKEWMKYLSYVGKHNVYNGETGRKFSIRMK
jgi:hypothetical protein